MKIFLFLALLLFSFGKSFGQNDLNLSDLKTPNSPGFQILDISPSSVERPTNPKEFSLKVLNLVGSGNAIPKNFAFEFSPFWYFKPKNQSIYKYLNISEDTSKGIFSSGFLRKANISFTSAYSDSSTASLLKNTNYIAFGVKTNIITFRTRTQSKKISQSILAAAHRIDDFQGDDVDIEKLEINLDKDSSFQENINIMNKLPLIQLDAAYAYSDAFPNNKYGSRRFNRSGFWGTLAINADFQNKNHTNHSLSFIFLFRGFKDNVLNDTAAGVFNKTNSYDLGSKIEYNINRFSISVEYLKRTNNDNTKLKSERTVGILQYKVNDNLYLLGTYGKNFGSFNNVFTVLGINWGFGKTQLSVPEK